MKLWDWFKKKNKMVQILLVVLTLYVGSAVFAGVYSELTMSDEDRAAITAEKNAEKAEKEKAKLAKSEEKAALEKEEKEKVEQEEKEKIEKEQAEKEQEKIEQEKQEAERVEKEKQEAQAKLEVEVTEKEKTKEQVVKEEKPKVEPKKDSKSIEEQVEEVLSENKNGEFIVMRGQFFEEPYSLQVEYLGKESWSNKLTTESMKLVVRNALYEIKELDLNITNMGISVKYPLKDQYGNVSDEYVIKSDFNGEAIDKLVEDMMEFNTDNLQSIADSWWEHDAIKQ